MNSARAILSSVACLALQNVSTLSHIPHDFGKLVLNIKCAFWFSLQLLPEIFIILRRTKPGMVKLFTGLHVKYPLIMSDFDETFIFATYFRKMFK